MVSAPPLNETQLPLAGTNAVSTNESAAHDVNNLYPTSIDGAPSKAGPLPSSSSTVKTPALHPSEATTPPPTPPLSPDQSVKYDTLLSTVGSWVNTIPTSSKPKSPTGPLTDAERMWLTRECLLRYLRAAQWSLPEATKRLLATLLWRREYFDPTHDGDYFSPENETGKCAIYGWDMVGRTCLYLNPAAQNTVTVNKQVEHMFFMLERCIDILLPGQETLALLVSFKGVMQSPKMGLGRGILQILQTHYPERLGTALLINLPWLVWTFLKVIGPFIDPYTRAKIKYDQDLKNFVPPEQLIKPYGGEVDFIYDHQVYWPALLELAASRREEYTARWIRGGKRIGESERYLRGGEEKGVGEQEGGEETAVQGGANGVV